ncbi:MAG: SH3 domain-containing protein [Anaerolineae bacterium]|nr:SH3 domain-containing protein [Anaerolineae bacterium]
MSKDYEDCHLLASKRQTAEHSPDSDDILGADVDSIDQSGIDLVGPNLTDIDLTGADLVSMDLPGEDIEESVRPRRRLWPRLFVVAIGVGIIGSVIFFGKVLWERSVSASALPTVTLSDVLPQPSETPTATMEPTALPTATFPPTATLEPTPEATATTSLEPSSVATEPMKLTLAFDSYVRSGPGRDFENVAYLNAGTSLIILGRDLDGFWLLVRLDDGKEGWIAVTQFTAGTVDIEAIPVAPDIPTLDVTETTEG